MLDCRGWIESSFSLGKSGRLHFRLYNIDQRAYSPEIFARLSGPHFQAFEHPRDMGLSLFVSPETIVEFTRFSREGIPSWDPDIAYNRGQEAQLNDCVYISRFTGNQGNRPQGNGNEAWARKDEIWKGGTYQPGDQAWYQNTLWEALKQTSTAPKKTSGDWRAVYRPEGFTVSFYKRTDFDLTSMSRNRDERRQPLPGAEPFVSYVYDNPDPEEPDPKRLRCRKYENGELVDTTIHRQDGDSFYTQNDKGYRSESVNIGVFNRDSNVGDIATKRIRVWENDELVTDKFRRYQLYPWGDEMIEETFWPDGAKLTNRYSFYDDPADPDSYKMTKLEIEPDGDWIYHIYEGSGLNTIRQTADIPPPGPDATTEEVLAMTRADVRRIKELTDNEIDPKWDAANGKLQAKIIYLNDDEVHRSYTLEHPGHEQLENGDRVRVKSYISVNKAGAAWDDPANETTIKRFYESGQNKRALHSIIRPNQTIEFYTYKQDFKLDNAGVIKVDTITREVGFFFAETGEMEPFWREEIQKTAGEVTAHVAYQIDKTGAESEVDPKAPPAAVYELETE